MTEVIQLTGFDRIFDRKDYIMLRNINNWLKKERVLTISTAFALLTMIFVRPSTDYIEYIDFRVLALLFSLMAVVAGISGQGVFLLLSEKLFDKVKTVRGMCNILITACFLSSMWITNDVAIITFVPFAVLMLKQSGQEKYMIYVIIMQTIAANLGSMLTPVGNPQNLYLYSFYHLAEINFLMITIPLVLASFILLNLINLFIKKEPVKLAAGPGIGESVNGQNPETVYNVMSMETDKVICSGNRIHIAVYFSLFILCLLAVLHLVDYRIVLAVVILVIGAMDKQLLKKVDYSLLLTFISFFIFSGNLGNIKVVHQFISDMVISREAAAAILLSQVISNVPAAVLLSNFTSDAGSLIVGTNLGGLGTIIASLASLISFRIYLKTEKPRGLKFLGFFTAANVGMLSILVVIHYFVL